MYQSDYSHLEYLKDMFPAERKIYEEEEWNHALCDTPESANIEALRDILKEISGDKPLQRVEEDNYTKLTASIVLRDPNKVIRVKPMVYVPGDKEEFDKQIKELLEMGLIIPSKSPHCSPAFLVENEAERRRGKKRMVINYKSLNKETIDDGYFLPKKEHLLSLIRGKKIFSSFDCKSGFWQVVLDKDSRPLTAFSCPQGQYEWRVLPFGLKQAPGIFQRHMDKILEEHHKYCCVYVDDILVFSNTMKEHLKHVAKVLCDVKQHKVLLSPKKVTLCQEKINFLGLEIEDGHHKLQPHILRNIHSFPDTIENKTQLQRFLGCLTYAEGYINKLAQIRKPLQGLLKKDAKWEWTDQLTNYIKKVKRHLTELPTLYHPGENDLMIIETDASDQYWGAVLKAKVDNTDREELCRYTSGSFQGSELNYHSNEKEFLAVKKAIDKFKIYVASAQFIVRTDNKQFAGFLRNNVKGSYKQGRLLRWQQWFNYYKFTVEHLPGIKNSLADTLTREFSFLAKA